MKYFIYFKYFYSQLIRLAITYNTDTGQCHGKITEAMCCNWVVADH